MADEYALHPHAGSVWVKACQLWAYYVENETWTLNYAWTVFSNGSENFRTLKIIIDDTTIVTNYWLILADTPVIETNGQHSPDYVGSRPGFASAPPVKQFTYGARDTIVDYTTNMHTIRLQLFTYCTGRSEEAQQYVDGNSYNGWVHFRTWSVLYKAYVGAFVLVDQVCVQHGDIKAAFDAAPDNPYMLGQQGTTSGSGGGGTIDITPIVEALQDIALIDYDLAINNGATMFSVRGKVRSD